MPGKRRSVKKSGPHLSLAVLCQKVLEDTPGVLGLLGIFDCLTLHPKSPDAAETPKTVLTVLAAVGFRSGDFTGIGRVKIVGTSPSGDAIAEVTTPVAFQGNEQGCVTQAPIALPVDGEGLYWFDVYLDKKRVTRIPLRIKYQFGEPVA